MKILQTVKKVPGGMMVVPLLMGACVNTFFPGFWTAFDGTFTTHLWKSGAMPILAVFLFCNGATIDFKKAGIPLAKGVIITVIKVIVGIGKYIVQDLSPSRPRMRQSVARLMPRRRAVRLRFMPSSARTCTTTR